MTKFRRLVWTALFPCVIFLMAGTTPQISVAQKAAPQTRGSVAQEKPRFKAILEPINYKEDVEFTDVFFINDKLGWASGSVGFGKGGFILNTTDGGDTWSIQIGDLQSNERAYQNLRFLDEKHGFAVQGTGSGDHKLLRTTDGETWEVSGTVPQHRGDYTFISPTVGLASYGNQIFRTQDAGRTWKEVLNCEIKAEVEGLTKNVKCGFGSFHFPSKTVGYAIGSSYLYPAVNALFVAKTEDSGASWKVWTVLPGQSGKDGDVFFTDENTGFLRAGYGNVYSTSDGGITWSGVVGTDAPGGPEIKFTDSNVGWAIGAYGNFNFTGDGGKRWASRKLKFPGYVRAFSFPRRDRGYLVGEHGMIYRYRIVPVNYTARGIIDAPMMPGAEPSTP